MPTRRRALVEFGARLSLLLAGCAFALLACEGLLRWLAPPAARGAGHEVWPPHLSAAFSPDPALMPGIRGPSRFRANSRGLRGDEIPDDPSYRILACGGSTTECLFLDQAETWPQRLQDKLSAGPPGPRVWVGNAGKSGLTTRDHVVQLLYLLPELPRIDTVLFLVGVNDLSMRNLQDADYDPDFMARPGAVGALLPRAFGGYPLDDPALPWYRRLALWELARRAKRQARATARDTQDAAGGNYVAGGPRDRRPRDFERRCRTSPRRSRSTPATSPASSTSPARGVCDRSS